jgi:hypothetical protein
MAAKGTVCGKVKEAMLWSPLKVYYIHCEIKNDSLLLLRSTTLSWLGQLKGNL